MRGGAHAPMSLDELEGKFLDNAVYGGWSKPDGEAARSVISGLFTAQTTSALRQLRI